MLEIARKKIVSVWLLSISLLIMTIVVVGALTRLTGSGLSMVDWRPIFGLLPPITVDQWNAVFDQYKQFPQYKITNSTMNLSEFKVIFYWEYIHRVLGRIIGLVIIVPWLFFIIKKWIPKWMIVRGAIFSILVIIQGGMGWYMVKSGLVETPTVSHFRLAAHLTLALTLLQCVLWTLMDVYQHTKITVSKRIKTLVLFFTGGIIIQIVYGAFTAGLKAGWAFNTYPKMAGVWLPQGAWQYASVIENALKNPILVQFIHRHLAWALVLLFIVIMIQCKQHVKEIQTHSLIRAIGLILLVQIGIGIATLVLRVPIALGVLHQFVGMILLSCVIALNHSIRYR